MSNNATDLSGLSRAATAEPDTAVSRIPQPSVKWSTRIVLPLVILLITAGLLGYSARDTLAPTTTVRVVPALVKHDDAVPNAGTVVVQAPGWVEADPFPIAVSALADGVVREMLVLEGSRVKQDQVVARLIDDDARIELDHAEALLGERQAGVAVAQSLLAEAEQNWKHPIELTRKLRTAEAELDEKRAQLDRWPFELTAEQAHETYLKAEHERVVRLAEAGRASTIEAVQAKQTYEAQRATVEAIRKREDILSAGVRVLEAEVTAARENLELRIADTRAVAEAKAAVQLAVAALATATAVRAEAALRLERMEVRSPADGIVMNRLVEPGSKLMLNMDNPRSAQVARLYDPKKLQVRVDIPLVEAAKVSVGQRAEVIVDVLPERVYCGRVTRVVHEADVQKNTLQVKVAIDNPSHELKPEMLARARFLAMKATDDSATAGAGAERLFVPQAAIVEAGGQASVWLADQVDQVAVLQAVELAGVVRDGWVAVSTGLHLGDRVIVDAPADLTQGSRIQLIED